MMPAHDQLLSVLDKFLIKCVAATLPLLIMISALYMKQMFYERRLESGPCHSVPAFSELLNACKQQLQTQARNHDTWMLAL